MKCSQIKITRQIDVYCPSCWADSRYTAVIPIAELRYKNLTNHETVCVECNSKIKFQIKSSIDTNESFKFESINEEIGE